MLPLAAQLEVGYLGIFCYISKITQLKITKSNGTIKTLLVVLNAKLPFTQLNT